jgi:hypothetical protein
MKEQHLEASHPHTLLKRAFLLPCLNNNTIIKGKKKEKKRLLTKHTRTYIYKQRA